MLGVGLCTGKYCMPVKAERQARLFSGMRKHTVPVVTG